MISMDGYIDRLEHSNDIFQKEVNSLENEVKSKDATIYNYKEEILYMKDINKPIPLQIAENIHKESTYLLGEWDCSDKTNEWVRRMRQQGYNPTNYTVGMLLKEDGTYECHAWGEYLQGVEITYPRFIEGVEMGSTYIKTPSRQEVECEVC